MSPYLTKLVKTTLAFLNVFRPFLDQAVSMFDHFPVWF